MAGSYRDKGMYHCVRCSKDNPRHVAVNKILTDLNTDIYKSKNQFIIDAIYYYSQMLNEDDLTNTAVRENAKKERVLRESHMEELKKSILDELMITVQRDVISMLGYALSNRSGTACQMISESGINATQEEQSVNPVVASMASLWGEDEETEE